MNLLLGVCGSISAYKSIDIARAWVKLGHNVKVILSRGAEEFVLPNTFKYLGIEEVYTSKDDFNLKYYKKEKTVLHVELATWCDRFIVAPLSANTAGKLANGLADDLMTSTFLATPKETPIIIYPAMNTKMLEHPFVEENLAKLGTLANLLVHPSEFGELVCGETGTGKLPTVAAVVENSLGMNPMNHSKKMVLISTGATIAPLDPVRYLTNPSSGLTGYHLAIEAHKRGYQVVILAGQFSHEKINLLKYYPNMIVEKVRTTQDMKDTVGKYFSKCDLYISSAAISDIEFDTADGKLKKDQINQSIPVKKAPDVLKAMLDLKTSVQKVVGFAAETNLSQEILTKKWHQKPVDLLVGTSVNNGLSKGGTLQGFGNESADYQLFSDGKTFWEGALSKENLSRKILDQVGFDGSH